MATRDRSYQDFLDGFMSMAGWERVFTQDEGIINMAFNRALRNAWEMAEWPRVCKYGEARTPNGSSIVQFEESGETTIGDVFEVWEDDPTTTANPALHPYTLVETGILMLGSTIPTTAYIWYRKEVDVHKGVDHDSTLTFTQNDVRYDDTTGYFYRVTSSSVPANILITDTSYWEKLTIPHEFFEYCVHKAYAAWLRADKQNDVAILEDRAAEEEINRALDVLQRQQDISGYTRFKTRPMPAN